MSKGKIFICLLFFTFSVSAQKNNPELQKMADSINLILKANPLAYYTDHNNNSAFIRQVNLSHDGMVRFTDSIPKDESKSKKHNKKELLPDCCPPKTIRTLDLFAIKQWEIFFPTAYLKDKNNETCGRIIGLKKEDLYKLKEQFDKLKNLCRKEETTTKQ
jgi:hypothetical protein